MSLEFSRRSFLKYSAVAAVAVAGAGLFTGCKDTGDSYNLLKTGAGELTILQVTAGMGYNTESEKYDAAPDLSADDITTLSFPMKITNGRTNPIYINPTNFKVTVTSEDGNTVKKYSVTVDNDLYNTNLKKGSTATGKVTVDLSTALVAGDTVVLTYCPDIQYNEYSLNWKLTKEAKADSSSSES